MRMLTSFGVQISHLYSLRLAYVTGMESPPSRSWVFVPSVKYVTKFMEKSSSKRERVMAWRDDGGKSESRHTPTNDVCDTSISGSGQNTVEKNLHLGYCIHLAVLVSKLERTPAGVVRLSQIFLVELHACQLLPDERRKIKREEIPGPHRHSHNLRHTMWGLGFRIVMLSTKKETLMREGFGLNFEGKKLEGCDLPDQEGNV